jgi:hypothetical protein
VPPATPQAPRQRCNNGITRNRKHRHSGTTRYCKLPRPHHKAPQAPSRRYPGNAIKAATESSVQHKVPQEPAKVGTRCHKRRNNGTARQHKVPQRHNKALRCHNTQQGHTSTATTLPQGTTRRHKYCYHEYHQAPQANTSIVVVAPQGTASSAATVPQRVHKDDKVTQLTARYHKHRRRFTTRYHIMPQSPPPQSYRNGTMKALAPHGTTSTATAVPQGTARSCTKVPQGPASTSRRYQGNAARCGARCATREATMVPQGTTRTTRIAQCTARYHKLHQSGYTTVPLGTIGTATPPPQLSTRCHERHHNGTTSYHKTRENSTTRYHKAPQAPPPQRHHHTQKAPSYTRSTVPQDTTRYHKLLQASPQQNHKPSQGTAATATTLPQGTRRHHKQSQNFYRTAPQGTASTRRYHKLCRIGATLQGTTRSAKTHNKIPDEPNDSTARYPKVPQAAPQQFATIHHKVPQRTTRYHKLPRAASQRCHNVQTQTASTAATAAPRYHNGIASSTRYQQAQPLRHARGTTNTSTQRYHKVLHVSQATPKSLQIAQAPPRLCHKVLRAPPQRYHQVPRASPHRYRKAPQRATRTDTMALRGATMYHKRRQNSSSYHMVPRGTTSTRRYRNHSRIGITRRNEVLQAPTHT